MMLVCKSDSAILSSANTNCLWLAQLNKHVAVRVHNTDTNDTMLRLRNSCDILIPSGWRNVDGMTLGYAKNNVEENYRDY